MNTTPDQIEAALSAVTRVDNCFCHNGQCFDTSDTLRTAIASLRAEIDALKHRTIEQGEVIDRLRRRIQDGE